MHSQYHAKYAFYVRVEYCKGAEIIGNKHTHS